MEREQEGHRFERRDGDGPLWGGDCWPESWMDDDTRHVSMRGRGCPWGWNRDPGLVWNESQLGKEQQWERGQMGCQQIPAASSASSPSEPHRLRLPSFFHWHSFSSAVQTQKPSLMSREVISCSEVRFLMCEWHFSFLFFVMCFDHTGLFCFSCESGLCQWYRSGRNSNWCRSVYPEISRYCKTDRMFFPTKKIAVICPEARASYQRGCLRTKERVTAEGCSGPEALDQTEALAAGAGGHQCTAQETGRPPPGLSGLPGAGVCQHPCTHETKLRPGQPGSALADKSAQRVCQTSLFIDVTFGRTLCQRMRWV